MGLIVKWQCLQWFFPLKFLFNGFKIISKSQQSTPNCLLNVLKRKEKKIFTAMLDKSNSQCNVLESCLHQAADICMLYKQDILSAKIQLISIWSNWQKWENSIIFRDFFKLSVTIVDNIAWVFSLSSSRWCREVENIDLQKSLNSSAANV